MGTITSGTGLISGLPISTLVDQLMAIEARPRNLLQSQATTLSAVKTAWMDLSARLLSLKSSASTFDEAETFQAVAATSSDTSVLTASAQAGAAQGNYQFTPVRLMSNHQVISSGRADSDATAVGAGTITIDFGHGNLDAATDLDFLNGQAGVTRGKIEVTDRSGSAATIDLTTATSVQDVLDAINNASGISVTASVSGDAIVLTDTSGSVAENLRVEELDGGSTAASLGILDSVAGNVLTGDDIVSINAATNMADLNDGNGVRIRSGNDIKFTLEDGTELLVNLSGATTVGDVLGAINSAAGNGGKLVAAIASDDDRLQLTDTTGGLVGPLTVEAVNDSKAALDLGLLGSDGDADHVISGKRLAAGLNSVLLRNLNGGAGVAAGAISIQDRGTGSAVVDLSSAETVQEVVDAINAAGGVSVTASLNSVGNGLLIADTTGQSLRNFAIAESGGTTAADLNLLHDAADTSANSGHLQHRYISENTTLAELNIARGRFVITDSAGHSGTVDLTQGNETTLADVIGEINSRGIGVTASINSAGNGLLLTDTASGAGRMRVVESGSTTAADLGILGSDSDDDGLIDGARRLSVTVGADDTLQDVADALAAASSDLSVVVINDGGSVNPYRLVVSSKVGGRAGRLVIDPGGTPLSFSTMSQPQDALLFLGDPDNPSAIAIRSQANSISNVIDGLTLNLVGTSSSPVSVSVTSSIDAFVARVNSFVTGFNATADRIDALTAYNSETNTAGVLQGDAAAIRIRNSLFSMITSRVSGASGSIDRLSQIGITVAADGAEIAFDGEKFRQAYASDPAAVSGLFTLATDGVGDRIDSALDKMTDGLTGSIHRQVDSLDSRTELISKRITQLDSLLARKRARLLRQFQAMETALSRLQSQSSALSGFTAALNLAASYSSSS